MRVVTTKRGTMGRVVRSVVYLCECGVLIGIPLDDGEEIPTEVSCPTCGRMAPFAAEGTDHE